jgi:hypothetical protein
VPASFRLSTGSRDVYIVEKDDDERWYKFDLQENREAVLKAVETVNAALDFCDAYEKVQKAEREGIYPDDLRTVQGQEPRGMQGRKLV